MYGDGIDFDAQSVARQPRHLHRRPRRAVRAERARVDLVHLRELFHVDEEHAAADDVLQAGAGGLENRGDVLQDLFGLRRRRPAPGGPCPARGRPARRRRRGCRRSSPGEYGPTGVGKIAAGDGLHSVGHPVILVETGDLRMRAALLLVLALAQAAVRPRARRSSSARTRDQRCFDVVQPRLRARRSPASIDRAEIITEFRRAVLIVREQAAHGELGITDAAISAKAMAPFDGQVSFVVQVRLHPLNTYTKAPSYDLYIRPGRRRRRSPPSRSSAIRSIRPASVRAARDVGRAPRGDVPARRHRGAPPRRRSSSPTTRRTCSGGAHRSVALSMIADRPIVHRLDVVHARRRV